MATRPLLLGTGFLLLAVAGVWSAHRLAPGEDEIAGWPGALTVNGIAPRWTSLDQIAARLGPPDAESVYGAGLPRAQYRTPAAGIAELTLWLDEDRYVRWARVVPATALPVAVVARSLRGFAAQEGTRSYLSVEGGIVTEVWLVDQCISWRRMAREM